MSLSQSLMSELIKDLACTSCDLEKSMVTSEKIAVDIDSVD
jgi:hypothetical protein